MSLMQRSSGSGLFGQRRQNETAHSGATVWAFFVLGAIHAQDISISMPPGCCADGQYQEITHARLVFLTVMCSDGAFF